MLQENKGKLLNIYSNTNKNYAMSEKLKFLKKNFLNISR